MGSQRSLETVGTSQTSKTTFDKASEQELALRKQFEDLGVQQAGALANMLTRATSGSMLELTGGDQEQLNKAYDSARQRLEMGGKDYADFLSGSRGLRMSDTPISQQALDRFGLGLADLESQRANAGLNLGLNANQLRLNALLGGASALPSGSVAAFNPIFQERMGSGTTTTSGTQTVATRNTPSFGTQLGQGLGIASGLGAIGMGFMGGVPGLSSAFAPATQAGGLTGFNQGGYNFLVNTPKP